MVPDLVHMEIRCEVPAATAAGLEQGMPVMVTVDAFPDDVFPATLSSSRESDPASGTVLVTAIIAESKSKLRPGNDRFSKNRG